MEEQFLVLLTTLTIAARWDCLQPPPDCSTNKLRCMRRLPHLLVCQPLILPH
jgi:hypothetical protein